MKKITTIIIIFLAINLNAQDATQIKKSVQKSDLVIEGKVVSTKTFKDEKTNNIYTTCKVNVSKFFKGQLDNKTITVIKKGGIFNDEFQFLSHDLAIYKDAEGLFFLKEYDFENSSTGGKNYRIYDYTEYFFDGINPAAVGQGNSYKNLESDLYQKIQDATNLQPRVIAANTIELKNGFQIPHIITDPNFLPPVRGISNNSRSSVGIEYSLDNIQVTGTSPKYLEFDVMVRGTSSGTKISSIAVALAYNAQAFGYSIVANNKITTTIGSYFNSTAYTNVFYTQDRPVPPPTLPIDTVIIGSLTSPSDVPNLVTLPTSPTQFVHVKMQIANCNQQSEVYFDISRMENISDHYTGIGVTGYEVYNPVVANDSINILLCPTTPVIYDFNPKQITAGTGSTLTITGDNFGTAKGKVFFTNADDDGVNIFMHTFPPDITSWTNTQIIVKVPSIEFTNKSAGSGVFYVQLPNNATANSGQALDVLYAVQTARNPSDSSAIRVSITDNGNDSLGYKFYNDSLLNATPNANACIRTALKKWNCATGVTWQLAGTQNVITNPNSADGVNYLYLADESEFTEPNTTAQTYNNGRIGVCGGPKYYCTEIDIAFRKSKPFTYDTSATTITNNSFDFHSVALHELGHGHRLQHALPTPKVMFPKLNLNEKRASLTSYDLDGGLNVIQFSQTALTPPCASANVQLLPSNCSFVVIGIQKINSHSAIDLSVYPNPFSNNLAVKLNLSEPSYINFQLVDILGKTMYQYMEREISNSGEQTIELNFYKAAQIPKGFYSLVTTINGQSFVSKLLKLEE